MSSPAGSVLPPPGQVAALAAYMTERWHIRERRRAGQPAPWTDDPILRQWKFTNVRREWDRTTRFIRNWALPYADHHLLGLNLAMARLLGWPDTLADVGFQTDWHPDRLTSHLYSRAQSGQKVFTGAYVVPNCGQARPKIEQVVRYILQPLWDSALLQPPVLADMPSVAALHERLVALPGLADFLAQEIEQDLVHQPGVRAVPWPDATTFAVAGPGAMRGLNRVYERPLGKRVRQLQALTEMKLLRLQLQPVLPPALGAELTVHDVEFNLCEFDKYERVRTGQGTPRARYTPFTTIP